MSIAILGYGKEGHSVESYFKKLGETIKIFDNFEEKDIENFHLEDYDLVFRSPSVRPCGNFSSVTKYFFDHCPCPIIGVTGTKGNGTTCSMITKILETLGKKSLASRQHRPSGSGYFSPSFTRRCCSLRNEQFPTLGSRKIPAHRCSS